MTEGNAVPHKEENHMNEPDSPYEQSSGYVPSQRAADEGFEFRRGRVPEGKELEVEFARALSDLVGIVEMMGEALRRGTKPNDSVSQLVHYTVDAQRKMIVMWETMTEEELAMARAQREGMSRG